jgi:putative transposase
MAKRIPASMRTREALAALIEGRLASPAGRSELVELATRLIVEEVLEGEVRDALDRGYYEHGEEPGRGHRNGHRTQRLKTAEGALDYSAPQVAGLEAPFRSALREHLKGPHRGARGPGGGDAGAGPVGARQPQVGLPPDRLPEP